MAMGSKGQRQAEAAIRSNRPFKNSTGSFSGTRGSARDLGWLRNHPEAARIRELLGRATYIVWSHGTPLGCVAEDEGGDPTNYYFDESFSTTTSHHQSILRYAFSDFETVGSGPWSRAMGRSRAPRRAVIGRPQTPSLRELGNRIHETTEGYGHAPRASVEEINANTRAWGEAARREPTAAHVYATLAAEQRRAERERAANVRAMENGANMAAYERENRPTREQMLDPRYGDPDWTPWSTFGGNLPEGADERDRERVERDGGVWTL